MAGFSAEEVLRNVQANCEARRVARDEQVAALDEANRAEHGRLWEAITGLKVEVAKTSTKVALIVGVLSALLSWILGKL